MNKTAPGEVGSDGHKAASRAAGQRPAAVRAPGQRAAQRIALAAAHGHGRADQRARAGPRAAELLVHHDGVVANLRDVGVGVSQVLPVLAVAYCAARQHRAAGGPKSTCTRWPRPCWPSCLRRGGPAAPGAVLVETHSRHLFRRMQTLIARRQTSTAQCRMLFVERRGADAVLVPLDVDEFGAVRNWPPLLATRWAGTRTSPGPCPAS